MRTPRTHQRLSSLALALVAGCGGATVPDPDEGEFVGRWGGRLWLGDATASLSTGVPGGDVLYVGGSRPRGADTWGVDERLSAQVVFSGPGLYTLGSNDVSFLELVGGDGISAEYKGSGEPAGVLNVTRYDQSTGMIEGELRFSAATNSPYASYGSTAQFEDGRFRAVVRTLPINARGGSP
jgi:hypothetical protein